MGDCWHCSNVENIYRSVSPLIETKRELYVKCSAYNCKVNLSRQDDTREKCEQFNERKGWSLKRVILREAAKEVKRLLEYL